MIYKTPTSSIILTSMSKINYSINYYFFLLIFRHIEKLILGIGVNIIDEVGVLYTIGFVSIYSIQWYYNHLLFFYICKVKN